MNDPANRRQQPPYPGPLRRASRHYLTVKGPRRWRSPRLEEVKGCESILVLCYFVFLFLLVYDSASAMATFAFKNLIFLMQKHLSSSSSSPSLSTTTSFTVQYLVNSCGVPLPSAIAASKNLRLDENNIQRYDSVLHLFRSHGFDGTHIAKMIQKQPILLTNCQADEILRPKLEFLVGNGFADPHLHDLIVSSPRILMCSLSNSIKPSLHFLRSFLGTEDRVVVAVKRAPWLLCCDLKVKLQANIDLFVKEGVHVDDVAHFCVTRPNYLLSSSERMSSALKTVKTQYVVDSLSSNKFMLAVSVMASMSCSIWEKKVGVLKSFGWSQDQVWSLFGSSPLSFVSSEDKLKCLLDFYVNTIWFNPVTIIRCPILLIYSIDKRVVPRYNVLKLLLANNLLQEDIAKLVWFFTIEEHLFLKRYVNGNLHQVPNMYTNDKMANKIGT